MSYKEYCFKSVLEHLGWPGSYHHWYEKVHKGRLTKAQSEAFNKATKEAPLKFNGKALVPQEVLEWIRSRKSSMGTAKLIGCPLPKIMSIKNITYQDHYMDVNPLEKAIKCIKEENEN